MRRIASISLCIGLFSGVAEAGDLPCGLSQSGVVTVDGLLDDWAGVQGINLSGGASGDAGGIVRCNYDDAMLYLAVTITDDRLIRTKKAGATDDHLTFRFGGARLDVWPADTEKKVKAAVRWADGKTTKHVAVVDSLVKNGWSVELSMPLGRVPGGGKDAQMIPFELELHDADFASDRRIETVASTGEKRDGVGIVSVIYDLIPLTHPQFCDAGLVKVFNHWFDWIARTADGYIAISSTIRDQVRQEMVRRIGEQQVQERWFDYFHLGSELDLIDTTHAVDRDLLGLFKQPEPVFLMVSTIEPRKNHAYLLDAFERAWTAGSQARLCIVGKIGWKCETLIERIRRHPQLNSRLFMFNDLSDQSLEYAYQHSTALVFPSYVEGFGLPLVEAMQRGLPAMGSDIEVFREIGGEFMAYFDLNDPQSLTDLVTGMEHTGAFPANRNLDQWQWLSWRQASEQLVACIERHVDEAVLDRETACG